MKILAQSSPGIVALALSLSLMSAVAGCGGDDGGGPDSGPVPATSATNPASAATGVAVSSSLSVTFSEAMDPATLTTSTFTVTEPGASSVAGVVTYSGVTAVFTPAASLSFNTGYTATINTGVRSAGGVALAASHTWTFTTASAPDLTAPTVSSTVPANAATAVSIDGNVAVTFSEALDPASVTAATITLKRGTALVAGAVSYAGVTASFRPTAPLAASTTYTAMVSGVKDLAGNTLAASYAFTFTTGAAADTTLPTVSVVFPATSATAVATNSAVTATFSEAMRPLSVTSSTFTLTSPSSAAVAGSVVFDAPGKTATFQPNTSLAANTTFTAKVHGGAGGVTDLAGNALASDYTWSFTTGAAAGLSPVLLGSSINYVILAKSAISSVPASVVTGDVGISPAAASFITGFGLTAATGYATSPQVTGHIFAADYAPPTPSNLTTAVSDMQTAYTDAAGRPTPDFLELGTGAIGGMTLSPGLYKWTSTVTIPSDLTLNGGATAVWIFQVSGDLTESAAKHVFLTGGALAKNVFWQVAGAVNIGTTAHFEGILLSQTAITLQTGSSMNGRALAQTAVSLDTATVTQPAP